MKFIGGLRGGERREKGREKEEAGKGGKIYADPHKDQGRAHTFFLLTGLFHLDSLGMFFFLPSSTYLLQTAEYPTGLMAGKTESLKQTFTYFAELLLRKLLESFSLQASSV